MTATFLPIPAEERARRAGRAAFGAGWRPTVRATAPGRIELLGNHLDYNGGPVLCAAIDRRMVVLVDEGGQDSEVAVVAADVATATTALHPEELADWRNDGPPGEPFDYVRGLLAGARRRGLEIRPRARIALSGDVPIGFGVSSSAALCVGLVLALVPNDLPATETVLLAQEAEHRAGTPCGTMDQSASVAGGVIRFDGATLAVERLSPDLGEHVFTVLDSGVDRSLGASAYPTRVKESARARELAAAALGIEVPHLAALTVDQYRQLTEGDTPPLTGELADRVAHVVAETERVAEGMEALRRGDWPVFGRLMTASGRSSATLYDVSHPRVEELVAEARAVDGVLGARMMGGGGGGTALALLRHDRLGAVETTLRAGYYARYGMADQAGLIQTCAFAEGARRDPAYRQAAQLGRRA
jgi:galactokinase